MQTSSFTVRSKQIFKQNGYIRNSAVKANFRLVFYVLLLSTEFQTVVERSTLTSTFSTCIFRLRHLNIKSCSNCFDPYFDYKMYANEYKTLIKALIQNTSDLSLVNKNFSIISMKHPSKNL